MAQMTLPASLSDDRNRALLDLFERMGKLPWEVVITTNLDQVPADALPHLAWAWSVLDEGWDLARDDADRRDLLRRAILLHRRKGTPWAVRAGLAAIGLPARVIEWFAATPARPPYTFGVTIHRLASADADPLFALDAEVYSRARASIAHTKNTRSHLDFLRVTDELDGPHGLIAFARSGQIITILPENETSAEAVGTIGSIGVMQLHSFSLILPDEGPRA
jgi:phage tail P2-like protein